MLSIRMVRDSDESYDILRKIEFIAEVILNNLEIEEVTVRAGKDIHDPYIYAKFDLGDLDIAGLKSAIAVSCASSELFLSERIYAERELSLESSVALSEWLYPETYYAGGFYDDILRKPILIRRGVKETIMCNLNAESQEEKACLEQYIDILAEEAIKEAEKMLNCE